MKAQVNLNELWLAIKIEAAYQAYKAKQDNPRYGKIRRTFLKRFTRKD